MTYNQQQASEFKSTIEWDKKMKLCKVEKRTGKTGRDFFYGEFNKMFKIMLERNDYAKDKDEWNVSLVPVSYQKITAGDQNGASSNYPGANHPISGGTTQYRKPEQPQTEGGGGDVPW